MNLLDGKELAANILEEAADIAANYRQGSKSLVSLAIVVATEDESAHWYVRSIAKKAKKAGINCEILDLGPAASEEYIAGKLKELAEDPTIHGVILQTPLPKNIEIDHLLELIPVNKDVDGTNPQSMGRIVSGLEAFAPATAAAVMALLADANIALEGKQVTVVGRSRIVGKPVAHLLLDQNATVTICHSRTKELAAITKNADVLIVAIGKAKFVTSEYIRHGTVVIDVGTNVDEAGNLLGDIDFESVKDLDITLSPVPGGVGPVTTALLLKQTALAAAKAQML